MRALITEATGLVPDLPKTVGIRCGRCRPIARSSSGAASGLTCGRHRSPRSDLHACRWLSLAVMDWIRSCDGPTCPLPVTQVGPVSATPDGALITNRST